MKTFRDQGPETETTGSRPWEWKADWGDRSNPFAKKQKERPSASSTPKRDQFELKTGRSLSFMTRQYLLYFGFENVPDEKSFKQAYRNMLKEHHPDQIGVDASDVDVSKAKETTQEINARKDWIFKELKDFWAS